MLQSLQDISLLQKCSIEEATNYISFLSKDSLHLLLTDNYAYLLQLATELNSTLFLLLLKKLQSYSESEFNLVFMKCIPNRPNNTLMHCIARYQDATVFNHVTSNIPQEMFQRLMQTEDSLLVTPFQHVWQCQDEQVIKDTVYLMPIEFYQRSRETLDFSLKSNQRVSDFFKMELLSDLALSDFFWSYTNGRGDIDRHPYFYKAVKTLIKAHTTTSPTTLLSLNEVAPLEPFLDELLKLKTLDSETYSFIACGIMAIDETHFKRREAKYIYFLQFVFLTDDNQRLEQLVKYAFIGLMELKGLYRYDDTVSKDTLFLSLRDKSPIKFQFALTIVKDVLTKIYNANKKTVYLVRIADFVQYQNENIIPELKSLLKKTRHYFIAVRLANALLRIQGLTAASYIINLFQKYKIYYNAKDHTVVQLYDQLIMAGVKEVEILKANSFLISPINQLQFDWATEYLNKLIATNNFESCLNLKNSPIRKSFELLASMDITALLMHQTPGKVSDIEVFERPVNYLVEAIKRGSDLAFGSYLYLLTYMDNGEFAIRLAKLIYYESYPVFKKQRNTKRLADLIFKDTRWKATDKSFLLDIFFDKELVFAQNQRELLFDFLLIDYFNLLTKHAVCSSGYALLWLCKLPAIIQKRLLQASDLNLIVKKADGLLNKLPRSIVAILINRIHQLESYAIEILFTCAAIGIHFLALKEVREVLAKKMDNYNLLVVEFVINNYKNQDFRDSELAEIIFQHPQLLFIAEHRTKIYNSLLPMIDTLLANSRHLSSESHFLIQFLMSAKFRRRLGFPRLKEIILKYPNELQLITDLATMVLLISDTEFRQKRPDDVLKLAKANGVLKSLSDELKVEIIATMASNPEFQSWGKLYLPVMLTEVALSNYQYAVRLLETGFYDLIDEHHLFFIFYKHVGHEKFSDFCLQESDVYTPYTNFLDYALSIMADRDINRLLAEKSFRDLVQSKFFGTYRGEVMGIIAKHLAGYEQYLCRKQQEIISLFSCTKQVTIKKYILKNYLIVIHSLVKLDDLKKVIHQMTNNLQLIDQGMWGCLQLDTLYNDLKSVLNRIEGCHLQFQDCQLVHKY